ncbi:hypothetical protein KC19_VG137500 [Ceratodon purpureus]|uniref:Uncharacterized protein n=1 Tax=Ceratodon purpureus TaxID=3225 RepID=A0A8T0HQE2_CERPU|nr:hypothetical protein KC19_VG137500 [Ceratodon purpureus]
MTRAIRKWWTSATPLVYITWTGLPVRGIPRTSVDAALFILFSSRMTNRKTSPAVRLHVPTTQLEAPLPPPATPAATIQAPASAASRPRRSMATWKSFWAS